METFIEKSLSVLNKFCVQYCGVHPTLLSSRKRKFLVYFLTELGVRQKVISTFFLIHRSTLSKDLAKFKTNKNLVLDPFYIKICDYYKSQTEKI